MNVIVVIPTYNEVNNIAPMSKALMALPVPGIRLLIVDDNSPDGTAEAAEMAAGAYPGRVHLLRRPGKQGLGTAYKAGFDHALNMGADVIIQMDADFSHSPAYIPQMLELIDQYDVVVGSRYVKGGTIDDRWGFGRWLLSWWANSIYTRLILNTRQKDTTAGFKAWRRAALLGIGLERVQSNGYDFQVEMTYLAEKLGYRSCEIPIHFEDRRIGQSKMDMPVKIESALRVWDIRWRHHKLRPADRLQPAEEIPHPFIEHPY